MSERVLQRAVAVARASMAEDLPERYTNDEWGTRFPTAVRAHLRPGIHVLDVGGGRTPAIPPCERPEGTVYVGLDLSADELALAPEGSYDRCISSDVADFCPELEHSFDLVVCFQVLEHVRSSQAALENMHRYLTPGGHLVAQFSGTLSAFGLANRVVPQWAIQKMIDRLLGDRAYKTFPAYYDRCWYGALRRLLAGWSEVDIEPMYVGMGYFAFSRRVRATYLAWEELTVAKDWANLASYYLIDAAF
jgi:2-polyprenyl-6-hydroxyphenyl methylase/3-demethylubiquinone-9 3-methyltransferase